MEDVDARYEAGYDGGECKYMPGLMDGKRGW